MMRVLSSELPFPSTSDKCRLFNLRNRHNIRYVHQASASTAPRLRDLPNTSCMTSCVLDIGPFKSRALAVRLLSQCGRHHARRTGHSARTRCHRNTDECWFRPQARSHREVTIAGNDGAFRQPWGATLRTEMRSRAVSCVVPAKSWISRCCSIQVMYALRRSFRGSATASIMCPLRPRQRCSIRSGSAGFAMGSVTAIGETRNLVVFGRQMSTVSIAFDSNP
jgi:hypothetical protein